MGWPAAPGGDAASWLLNLEEKESVSYRFAHLPCGPGRSLILGFPAAQSFRSETRYLRNICGGNILTGLPKISPGGPIESLSSHPLESIPARGSTRWKSEPLWERLVFMCKTQGA